ncbi:U3 small nucleolar RNA-associated protein, partial [Ascosphaera atra]
MGWWDREVNLYRIAKRNEDTPVHKLVGKVLLQGEDNLSAAALSTDGRLLAAATLAETKMFTVRKRKSMSEEDSHILKVRKVELPQTIARDGARTVAISPDNKWLVVIRPDSQIYVARITIEEKGDGDDFKVTLSSTMGKLNRVARHERHAKETHGTHGSYDRTIKTLAFSSDSRIMACGDLAGCIDTWILRDVSAEDKTKQQKKANADSDDESDSEDEEENAVLEGQQWIQTPAESPLPRNPTSVLLLTFRPQASPKSPVDKLIAVNADHAILEFDVLQGKLSDWS